MLQNLGGIAGSYPIIRAGGTTQNRATYLANQTEALRARFSTPGADQPSLLTVGPAWFESFQQFPKGTRYIYGLNFYDGEEGKRKLCSKPVPLTAASARIYTHSRLAMKLMVCMVEYLPRNPSRSISS